MAIPIPMFWRFCDKYFKYSFLVLAEIIQDLGSAKLSQNGDKKFDLMKSLRNQ